MKMVSVTNVKGSELMVIQNFDVLNLGRNGDHKLPPCLKAPGCEPHCGQHEIGSHNEHT
jgi:hypothetical protein